MPIFVHPARTALLGVAAALCAALVILPFLRGNGPSPTGQSEIRMIRVVAEGGVVRLAWSDGEKASYTIYKSADPRQFATGEVHIVNGGTTWTDTDPGSSPVVFYRIE